MFVNFSQFFKKPAFLGVLSLAMMAFISCRDGGSTQSDSQPVRQSDPTPTLNTTQSIEAGGNTINLTQPVDNGGTGFHYICANNCEGSGSNAQGQCPVCGEELVHNTAYHSGGGNNEAPQIIGADDDFSSRIAPLGGSSPTPQTTAPATGNAQFHYICSAGCGGGGSAQGTCPNCGESLTHNAAFHTGGAANATPGVTSQTRPSQPNSNKYPSIFNTPGANAPAANVRSSSGGSGFHYICSAGCGGGGSAQGACPSCGSALVHNDAFH